MTFKKLALASAIALAPTAALAVDVLDDGMLSDVTGRDGIEIDIATGAPITADIYVHDTSGINTATYSYDGAIVIDNFSLNGLINIDIDAGDSSQAGSDPVLQVNINIPTATIITGDIRVANSQRDDATTGWGINTQSGVLLSTMTITLNNLTMNVQLGNEPQGNMIAVASSITNGVSINNFALNDAGGSLTGGAIGAANMLITDNGGGNLGVNVGVDATAAGLVIGVNTLGNGGGMDIRITDQYLGTTAAGIVGDVTVVGLNLSGSTITISGK
ncbi:MAG: DUF6160 family protein [Pseudomonadota bacterium]